MNEKVISANQPRRGFPRASEPHNLRQIIYRRRRSNTFGRDSKCELMAAMGNGAGGTRE